MTEHLNAQRGVGVLLRTQRNNCTNVLRMCANLIHIADIISL